MGTDRLGDDDIVRSVADDLPVGVWVARVPGGELVYANPTFAEIMGMGARGDVARGEYAAPYGIHDREGALYPEGRMPFVRAIAERRTVVVDDIVIHRTDGRKVYIRAQAKPVFRGDEISHVVIAFIDITREVDAEEARARSEAQARRAQRMESVGVLAGGIAHDFNNLLAAVKSIASTLATSEENAERRAALETVDTVCDSAVQLTRSLLAFAGRGRHRAAPVSLGDVVANVVNIVQRATDSRIEVTMDVDTDRPVIGDESQLEQVVMNLAVNARDAMPSGGRMGLRVRREGETVVLEVSDTGEGIPAELRDRVFEPYFSTRERAGHPGTGLGLATVYGIVEGHGGTIEIDDHRPRGTVMRVRFPAAPEARCRDSIPGPPPGPPVSGQGLLLVVEDHDVVRHAATATLEALGYRVIAAADGLEAVHLFEQRHDELAGVLLDLAMPGMDGRQTYEQLRRIDARVPVLLTTGYAMNEEVQGILDLGVRGFIQKPYDARSLAEALSRIVRVVDDVEGITKRVREHG